MAEQRAIKSTTWNDTWFGRLSTFEMLIWIGLFSKCADDQGRYQDDPALIRSKLFPYRDVRISAVAAALDTFEGHTVRYLKGERLAQIIKWWENQPMQYATPSNYPPPDGWKDRYRTNYKGKYICLNWDKMEDTQLGILLWRELEHLERPSSWISYLARLNPNLNPNQLITTHKAPPPALSDYPTSEKIICEITGWPVVPPSEENRDFLNSVDLIAARHKPIKDYLLPFWLAYDKRYPGSTRLGWLAWAATGKIPREEKRGNGNGNGASKPSIEKPLSETDPGAFAAEVEAVKAQLKAAKVKQHDRISS